MRGRWSLAIIGLILILAGGLTPPAPANLMANAVSTSQIKLTWSDGSSSETAFQVEVSDDGTATFRPLATVTLNRMGYFDRTFRLSSAAKRSFRLVYGSETSNTAKPFKRPRAGTLYPRTPPRHIARKKKH